MLWCCTHCNALNKLICTCMSIKYVLENFKNILTKINYFNNLINICSVPFIVKIKLKHLDVFHSHLYPAGAAKLSFLQCHFHERKIHIFRQWGVIQFQSSNWSVTKCNIRFGRCKYYNKYNQQWKLPSPFASLDRDHKTGRIARKLFTTRSGLAKQ